VSSSRQPEKALISYDPVTFGASTLTSAATAGLRIVFAQTATTADFGVVWPASAVTSDIVIVNDTAGGFYLCVRKDSALNQRTFVPAHAASSASGSRAIRMCAEAPTPGAGWSIFDSLKKASFLAADVHLDSTAAPIDFFISVPLAAVGTVGRDEWTAYSCPAIGTVGVSSDVLQTFFRTSAPVSGDVGIVPVRTVSRISPTGHTRRVRCVFNAEEVMGGNEQRYGGVSTY
jgi:hypothetical protein